MPSSTLSPLSLGPRLSATVVLSFASLIYEFVIAQLLASLVGGAIFQYSITIAVYTFFLGAGAYFYNVFVAKTKKEKVFLVIETALAASAIGFPIAILLLPTDVYFGVARIDCAMAYVSMVVIGFLSGVELPYLLDTERGKSMILGADYVGMFLASIAFPFVMLPFFGTLPTAFAVAALNLAVAFQTFDKKWLRLAMGSLALLGLIWALTQAEAINGFSTQMFLRKFDA